MQEYRVIEEDGLTVLKDIKSSFRMCVAKDIKLQPGRNTALLEATLYKEQGSFIKAGYYVFEALDSTNQPLVDINIDVFKNAVDYYFKSIVGTDYYVKSVPKSSSLCEAEIKVFQF